jgi:two-component sensor histidine kinase
MPNNPLRILVVDDNPDDRALVAREAEAGFPDAELREVGTRAEFEDALSAGPYDLVVTDLQLRWANGREVLTRVRTANAGCAVIMFTDSGDEMVAVELMKAGLDDYVVKSPRRLPRLRASMKIAADQVRNRSALNDRERQLKAAIAHQEVIVRELHHRVRNNIQTIISLLQLRARSKGEPLASELGELSGRMMALASVQSRIYDTEALDRVDFVGAITDIADDIVKANGGRAQIIPEIHGPLVLDVHRAMPLALICHEIILNALKHAWPDGKIGKLRLRIDPAAQPQEIWISDDGAGFVATASSAGLGTRLARSLAAEARATLRIDSEPGNGTTVTLSLQ